MPTSHQRFLLTLLIFLPGFVSAQENTENATPLSDFIDKLNIRLKTFEQRNSTGGAALGISYNYDEPALIKTAQQASPTNNYTQIDLVYTITARGNVAFNSRNNPGDFIETLASIGVNYSRRKPDDIDPQHKQKEQELAQLLSQLDETDPQYIRLSRSLDELRHSKPVNSAYSVSGSMYMGLESDQKFINKQGLFGLNISGHYLSYRAAKTYGQTTWPARFNLLDYPFALIRMLNGEGFVPRASALPSLEIAYARVEPRSNDPRASAGDTSPFHRIHASLSFKTHLGITDKNKNPIYFTANTRYYKELGAQSNVKAAGLDSYRYTVFTIESDNTYISYATGKLPLDATADVVYEIGWKFNF